MTQLVHGTTEESYLNKEEGVTMEREYGKTPNGNDFNGAWVVRANGIYVDHDSFRSDLAERQSLNLPLAYM